MQNQSRTLKRSGQTLTDDAAIREMVAKAMNERVFRGTESGKWVDRLVKGERNLVGRWQKNIPE